MFGINMKIQTTKGAKALLRTLALMVCCMIAVGSFIAFLQYERKQASEAHAKQLIEDGYSYEAAHKISDTEAGLIPVDDDYTALKED